MRELLKTQL